MSEYKATILTFSKRLTGYDSKDTDFEIRRKHHGTAPNITIWQGGAYNGSITLDERAAKELARTLLFITGADVVIEK